MSNEWLILHGGALGDLVLMIQLALHLPRVVQAGVLRVASRTDPGDLSACRPSITRQSTEGLGLHWLFSESDDPAPQRLRGLVRGARVLNALGDAQSVVHRRLQSLAPAAVCSLDPRPREGAERHITQQWQTQLEAQGVLVPKCIHQQPTQRGLGVPEELRRCGQELLAKAKPLEVSTLPQPLPEREGGYGMGSIIIHPGGGGRAKCWPLACFLEVARRLRDGAAAGVCFLIGPVEAEKWPEAELAALAGEFAVLRCPEPDELVAILAGARAFVGNDAGPAHLAALLGTPTVTIFGPTSAGVWRPLGPHVQVVAGDPDTPDSDWGIEYDDVVSAVAKSW